MKNNFSISNMQLKNIDKIINIQNEDNIKIVSKKSLEEDLKNDNYNYFVIKENDIILGFIGTSKNFDTMDILSIMILKSYRNMGLATYLLKYIFNFSIEHNIQKIFLEVRKSNLVAQNLYLKNGFRHINTRKNYYPDNLEDAYIYMKDLN